MTAASGMAATKNDRIIADVAARSLHRRPRVSVTVSRSNSSSSYDGEGGDRGASMTDITPP